MRGSVLLNQLYPATIEWHSPAPGEFDRWAERTGGSSYDAIGNLQRLAVLHCA